MKYSAIYYFLGVITILSSCKKEVDLDFNNIENKISVIGHGGMGIYSRRPLDSMESLFECLSHNSDGVEVDVQLTKDNQLVAYHDINLNGKSYCDGQISEKNWNEMSSCVYKSEPYTHYKIVNMDEVLTNFNKFDGKQLVFDIKLYPSEQESLDDYLSRYALAVHTIIQKYDLKDNVLIESQNEKFLGLMKDFNSDYKLFIYASYDEGFEIAQRLDLFGITISTKKVSGEQIAHAHQNNLRVAIWNTNTKKLNREGVDKDPDYIQTDNLSYLIKILK